MPLSQSAVELLKGREIEEYIAYTRNTRHETYSDWKDRIDQVDALIRGEIGYVNPDGVGVQAAMMISNLADMFPRDVARLASESEPTYSAPAYGDKLSDEKNAVLRSVIGRTYFDAINWDLLRPQLVMDYVITGTFFVGLWVDSSSPYPRAMRVDPRACYPNQYNGELQDLLVIQTLKREVAANLFPDLDFGGQAAKNSREVELLDYYGPEFCLKAVTTSGAGTGLQASGVQVLNAWPHECDKTPVAFQALPSPDGAFRGSMDQIGTSMAVKNKIVSLIVEEANQAVWAPWEERGVTNPTDIPGPNTIYHHNTSVDQSFMRRVAPSTFSNQLFGVLNFLDTEERGQLAYPQTRQGEIGQSQGSASFVTATMGTLTSVVREADRALARAQERIANIAFQMDEHHLDFEKPLLRAVEKKSTYVPSKDIKGLHRFQVEYGAGAGLDRVNTDTRLQNWYAAGLLSGKTALEQTDFVPDAATEMEARENEEISRAILQRFAADPSISLDFIARVWAVKRERGITLVEAYDAVKQEEAAQAQPEMPPQPGEAVPPEAGVPAEAAPAGAPVAPVAPFSPAPLAQYLTRS